MVINDDWRGSEKEKVLNLGLWWKIRTNILWALQATHKHPKRNKKFYANNFFIKVKNEGKFIHHFYIWIFWTREENKKKKIYKFNSRLCGKKDVQEKKM